MHRIQWECGNDTKGVVYLELGRSIGFEFEFAREFVAHVCLASFLREAWMAIYGKKGICLRDKIIERVGNHILHLQIDTILGYGKRVGEPIGDGIEMRRSLQEGIIEAIDPCRIVAQRIYLRWSQGANERHGVLWRSEDEGESMLLLARDLLEILTLLGLFEIP